MTTDAEYKQEQAHKINVRLHELLDVFGGRALATTKPCETACTHVIIGEWTALGAANVLGRHSTPGWQG